MQRVTLLTLLTPPVPRIVPEGVFDAFGWCASDTLEWRRPSRGPYATWDASTPIAGEDPARMVFVMHAECNFLPKELARVHAYGLDLAEECALAPYAIDDATDELYARRVRPRDLLWLAADNLNALYWGLHDWAHFHNHGPFERRAETELQCDAAALAWLWMNRDAAGLAGRGDGWERVRREVLGVCAKRFEDEGRPFDPSALDAARLVAFAEGARIE